MVDLFPAIRLSVDKPSKNKPLKKGLSKIQAPELSFGISRYVKSCQAYVFDQPKKIVLQINFYIK